MKIFILYFNWYNNMNYIEKYAYYVHKVLNFCLILKT
jgi:hypothetical protein